MSDDIKKRVGKKIRSLRKLRGFTQEELGEKAGISYKFIGQIERAEVNPSLSSLIKIAKALNVNVKELFPGEGEIYPQFSSQDLKLIKKALKLLGNAFSNI